MRDALEILLSPPHPAEGPARERACVGQLEIRTSSQVLTAGMDYYIRDYRPGPVVAADYVAEWLALNWWRLCHEPQSTSPDWWRAHEMTAIGEGFVWPAITIYSDGVRMTLLSGASVRPDAKPFRYFGAKPSVVAIATFQAAVGNFVDGLLERLTSAGAAGSDLSRIWTDLQAERNDAAIAERRRLEALMGRDPDEDNDHAIDALLHDAPSLGDDGIHELAAEAGNGGRLLDAATLRRLAEGGATGRPQDAATLHRHAGLPRWGDVPAYVIGERAAEALRMQEGLGDGPIADARLASLAGMQADGLAVPSQAPFAFALDDRKATAMVLRAKYPTGRRFELARLIGDRIAAPAGGALHVATRASTYRQKMQRSFAAELLGPFAAVEDFLQGDVSPDAQEEAAAYFQVSPLAIRTQLVNHHRLEREELGEDLDAAA